MNSQNRSLSAVFFALAAVFVVLAGAAAQAEEHSPDEQSRPHFYQPGSGYEREPEYKFSGVIQKMPESGLAGIWVIDARPIVVTPMTVIKEENGKAVLGAKIEVKGVLKGMDFMAVELEVKAGGKS